MREILFRGRRTDNDKWVEGFYLTSPEFDNIGLAVITADKPRHPHYVFKKTIGQHTGLTDKNGERIFEGDIVRRFVNEKELRGVVEYADGAFGVRFTDGAGQFICFFDCGEVIGNIHDNPELLKESEDTEGEG